MEDYKPDKIYDSSEKYDNMEQWICESIAVFTLMVIRDIPDEWKEQYTEPDRIGVMRAAMKDVQAGLDSGKFNVFSYQKKEYVSSLRSWFVEAILDFIFGDEKVWTSDKWQPSEIHRALPHCFQILLDDMKSV